MAKLIDGKAVSQKILQEIKEELNSIQINNPTFKPKLSIVQVGNRSDSNVYIRNKILRAKEVGFDAEVIKLGPETIQSQLEAKIDELNNDKSVDGIIIQLPLDSVNKIDSDSIVDRIEQHKDVDGLTRENAGRLMRGELDSTIFPCTPYGCLLLVQHATGDPNYVQGKNVVVIGRSKIVGSPAAALFMWHNGTVTICHSRTKNLEEQCRQADILVVAIGKQEMVHGSWIKHGAVVIDCGINVEELSDGKRKLRGDVHFESACERASYITPVPGGVGPMTIAMLIKNTLKQAIATKLKHISSTHWNLKPLELNLVDPVPSDIVISRSQKSKCIVKLAREIGIQNDELELYGNNKAKVSLKILHRLSASQNGKYVIVGAHNLLAAAIDARIFHEATQSDEALFNRLVPINKQGKRSFSAVQERRLTKLGIKSTSDGNDLSAEDRKRFSRLNIDKSAIYWNRIIDVNDRFLRKIEIGCSPTEKGQKRFSEFAISVSSELMAILALSTSLANLRERVAKIVVANDTDGNPVTADDVGVTGAITVLLKDTVKPNLMQTIEGTPVFVHAGPFANIAHGNSSVLADQIALKLVGNNGYVVTEAGFGSDIGIEKFINIKCRSSGLKPDVAVIVCTVRALKLHGGGPEILTGQVFPSEYTTKNLELLRAGCDSNLKKQVQNVLAYNIPVVVAINQFSTDTTEEFELIISKAKEFGVKAVVAKHWKKGGLGAIDLAKAVAEAAKQGSNNFKFLYSLCDSIEAKIEKIACETYGADGVDFSEISRQKIAQLTAQGFGNLPICMAKTQHSFTANPEIKGAPNGFRLPVCDIQLSVGAGFIYPFCGSITTMPGLSTRPCFFDIDIDPETEVIEGLF